MEIKVGGNSNIQSLNEALNLARQTNEKTTIDIFPTFIVKEQVVIENENLSHVTLKSTGTVKVDVASIMDAHRVTGDNGFDIRPVITVINGFSPNINVLFDLDPEVDAYDNLDTIKQSVSGMLCKQSRVFIHENKGFINAPFINLCLTDGSHGSCDYALFNGAGNRDDLTESNYAHYRGSGVLVSQSSFNGEHAQANDCGDNGFRFQHGSTGTINYAKAENCGHHNVIATNSSNISAQHGQFKNCIDDGVVAYASSQIDLRFSDCSYARVNYGVIATRTSHINFEGGIANGCGYSGVMANRGSSIDFTNGTCNLSGVDGVRCANTSQLDCTNALIRDSYRDGVHCTHGSTTQIRDATILRSRRDGVLSYSAKVFGNNATVTHSTRHNLLATRGGYISVFKGDISSGRTGNVLCTGGHVIITGSNCRNANGRGVECTNGGYVMANEVDASGSTDNGFSIYSGSVISANDSIGTTNRDVNTVTTHGIIYK